MRPALAGAVQVAVLLMVVACGTVSNPIPDSARPLPPPAESPLTVPGRSTATPSCGDVTASLRPPAVLPRPQDIPPGSDLRRTINRHYLTVGVRPDTPPFGSLNRDTGQFEGFDVAIATLVADKLFGGPGHVQFRALTASQRVPLVRDGEVDMVTASASPTCERRVDVDFSAVYYLTSTGVLVLRESRYGKLEDLGGRPVCAATGTTSIQRIVDAPSHPVPYPVANSTDCLVALQGGLVDGIVSDKLILAGMAAQDPRTRIVGTGTLADVPVAAITSKDRPDLTRFVNGVLATAMQDGTWAKICKKWLSTADQVPTPSPPTPHYRD